MNLKSILVVLICAAQLGACGGSGPLSDSLGRAARVDPAGVAARPVPKKPATNSASNAATNGRAKVGEDTSAPCYYLAPINGDREAAINLDCFKFQPGDTYTAYQLATGRDQNGNKIGKSEVKGGAGAGPAAAPAPAVAAAPAPAPVAAKKPEPATDGFGDEDFRQARNRLGFVLVNHADILCEREKGRIYGNRAASSSALDLFSSGFSITSTIVGGEQAKSILSGLAGLSTATRTNIDSNIYQNQLTSAITKMMDTERHTVLQKIQSKQQQPIKDFSADEMIVMANQYHQACSFQKGVQLLLDAAVNKEGVDQIVRAMNLRQVVLEADRFQGKFAADSAEYEAIRKAKGDALLELFQIAKTSSSVTITPTEQIKAADQVVPAPLAPGGK